MGDPNDELLRAHAFLTSMRANVPQHIVSEQFGREYNAALERLSATLGRDLMSDFGLTDAHFFRRLANSNSITGTKVYHEHQEVRRDLFLVRFDAVLGYLERLMAASTSAATGPQGETSAVGGPVIDYVDFGRRVLSVIKEIEDASPYGRTAGANAHEIISRLFPPEDDRTPPSLEGPGPQAFLDIHRELIAAGLLIIHAGNTLGTTREGRLYLDDPRPTWRSIAAQPLESDETAVVRELSRRSEQRAQDHAALAWVRYDDLTQALGWSTDDQGMQRVENAVASLREAGFATWWPYLDAQNLQARPTFAGMVWCTRGRPAVAPPSSARDTSTHPLRVFCAYSRQDESLLDDLKQHLAVLKRLNRISFWYDREITAGAQWEERIDEELDQADIILLLVSASFIDSDYCYGRETVRAMERHRSREAVVIPVIVRPVAAWQETPFGELQALPRDGKPVTSSTWANPDEAWVSVVDGIRTAIANL